MSSRLMATITSVTILAAGCTRPGGSEVGNRIAPGDSWVGKRIMLKKPDIKISRTEREDDREFVAELDLVVYVVLDEKGSRIQIGQRGVNGWFAKSDAVLQEDAVAYFTGRIQNDPKDVYAYTGRGDALALAGDLEKALKDFTEVIRLEPGSGYARSNRGNIYRDLKKYDKALADYSEGIRIDPKEPTVYNARAWLLAVCPQEKYRDGKKAVEDAKRACELTAWTEAAYLDTLAAAYAEVGEFDLAVKYQSQALSDTGFEKRYGERARRRLEMYKNKTAFRDD